ncbi:hypothetical protein D3C84_1274510 [compost metagenome]
MGEQPFGTASVLLKPLVTTFSEKAVTRQHVAEIGLSDVIKLLTSHIGLVEGNPH